MHTQVSEVDPCELCAGTGRLCFVHNEPLCQKHWDGWSMGIILIDCGDCFGTGKARIV